MRFHRYERGIRLDYSGCEIGLAPICNLHSVKAGQKHIADSARAVRDLTGNMPPMPAIFPNRMAPIVRVGADGVRELLMARWGFPPPEIPGSKPKNPYLTNVRNTDSRYWRTY